MPIRPLALLVLTVAYHLGTANAQPTDPKAQACPTEVPPNAACYTGEDGLGGFYWIALPANWKSETGVLVMHAHGGPADTGPATLARGEEDLKRWAVTVKAGYAWAGATYRRGGFGVSMAAEDTERVRRIFVKHFGPPRRTILHGQSYGASVAAKGAEMYATVDGPAGQVKGPYDGMLLTSGMLGGGTRAYDFRIDLRVVYQYVCRNHPKADEPQYPLWQGLPMDAKLTRAELANRVDECTGVRKPVAQRTEQQKANLANIVNVIRIPERSLIAHLNWATWLFRDLTQLRLGNRNPFNNANVQYKGSTDDAALNAGVLTPVGGSQPHTNFQPYLCVDFIISLFGIYPSPAKPGVADQGQPVIVKPGQTMASLRGLIDVQPAARPSAVAK